MIFHLNSTIGKISLSPVFISALLLLCPLSAIFAQPVLQITEIFSGQSGEDLTADWFEIVNVGDMAWVSGTDPDLYYDDESMDSLDATMIDGISGIQPGKAVIVLIGTADDVPVFTDVWGAVIVLDDVVIGYTDGAGLGGGGDLVTLWVGDPATTSPVHTASYPETDFNDGQSYDVELGEFSTVGNANGAVQTLAMGGDNMDVPNIGSPGNGPAAPTATELRIIEIFPGQSGDDLTADWFELVNDGNVAWVNGTDPDLYYDDESMDPLDATLIEGISDIQPGEIVIVLIGDADDVPVFRDVWSPVIVLDDLEIGYTDGAGLSGGGDLVTIWVGDPGATSPADTASYPDTEFNDGQSYDVDLGEFSTVGNANGAVQTLALGGNNMDVPNIGSPGNGPAVPTFTGLQITEIFAGQEGTDLTADWFEIVNTGDMAWVSGTDPDLYYDDESMDPLNAALIEGIPEIQPGEAAIVLIGTDEDVAVFVEVWDTVIILDGVPIGYTDGAGLGGGGDLVTLWAGDPFFYAPVDTASYPTTEDDDGQSYDVELGAFSVVGNDNQAVQTLAMGGDNMDVPNIGSPGNLGPRTGVRDRDLSHLVNAYPNPGRGPLYVELPEGYVLTAVSLYGTDGKRVSVPLPETGSRSLKFGQLPAGLNFLRLEFETGVAGIRLLRF